MAAWVKTQVGAWAHRIWVLGKISRWHPQLAYVGLGISLKIECHYLKKTVPGVGNLMGPIEEALKENPPPPPPPTLFGGEETDTDFRKKLGHRVKNGGLCIPDPRLSAKIVYNTCNAASGELVDSIPGRTALNYVGHRACVRGASAGKRKERKHVEMVELYRRKEIAGGQERNRLHRATRNGTWLRAIPHRLNDTELSREEFRDNICLIYGLMPQDIPTTCNGCGKSFSIEHAL